MVEPVSVELFDSFSVVAEVRGPFMPALTGLADQIGSGYMGPIVAAAQTGLGSPLAGLAEEFSRSWSNPFREQVEGSFMPALTGLADQIGSGYMGPILHQEEVGRAKSFADVLSLPAREYARPDLCRRVVIVAVVVWLWSQMVFDAQLANALGLLVIAVELARIVCGRGRDSD